MTDEEAQAIAARAEAATNGPWEQPAYPSGTMVYRLAERDHIADCEWATDADFIAHARTDIPALLDERAALLARETQLLAIIDGMSKGTVHLMSNRAVDEHGNEYPIIVEKQP